MRHERVLDKTSYEQVSVAAVWPAAPKTVHLPSIEVDEVARGAALAPVPAPGQNEAPVSTPAAPDLPAAVGVLIVASYVALIGAFFVAMAGSAESVFAITISALFLVAFFTVPRLFLAVEPKAGRRPSFDRFMREGLDTLTGRNTGAAVLVQMLLVPVSLTFAVLVMGIAAAIYL